MGIMAIYFGERARKCIVPDNKWDGDTGIEQMLAGHRSFDDDPMEIAEQRRAARLEDYRKRRHWTMYGHIGAHVQDNPML